LRARIAAEQGLGHQTGAATQAARRAAQAEEERVLNKEELAALRRPAQRRWLLAGALVVAVALGGYFVFVPKTTKLAGEKPGTPLKLKLEYRLPQKP
jgi:hypothetical protein